LPGKGKIVERDYTAPERASVAAGLSRHPESGDVKSPLLGARTCDVYLNDVAYWSNIPVRVSAPHRRHSVARTFTGRKLPEREGTYLFMENVARYSTDLEIQSRILREAWKRGPATEVRGFF
jgi:hypothetical protein